MKIDRRSFLSFVIGGAAGTTLSPLPWKMMDDSSIWSQNWPWTPVPANGRANTVDSVSAMCPGGCGIQVRKIDDRAVGIQGLPGYPGSDGGVCNHCLSGLQLLYGPTRIKHPLKRVGERGAGHWARISWDQALDEVVNGLADIRAGGQAHGLACISGTRHGTTAALLQRFMEAYGSPNYLNEPSIRDTYELALQMMHGGQPMAGFDLEESDFVLSFGSGIVDGWGASVRMFKAHSRWQAGSAKVVQIEARLSNTAAKADRWIAITPGTEADLALGLAHVIVKEGLYHKAFVNQYSQGFDQWRTRVLEQYPPDKVSQTTGVDKTALVELARAFVQADRPLALCGRGRGQVPGNLREFVAVHTLNALAGNINRKGGVTALPQPDYIRWPVVAKDDTAANGLQHERLDGAGGARYPHSRCLLNRLSEVVAAGEGYPLKALLVAEANPLYTLPDQQTVRAAVAKIPLVVSFSSYMDETAHMADLVLPNHANLERFEDLPAPAGWPKPMVGLARPVVALQHDTRHLGDAILDLARRLGGPVAQAFPWPDYDTCLQKTLGSKWRPMVQSGYWQDSAFTAPGWSSAFATASGRFEFINTDLTAVYATDAVKIEGDSRDYPLTLIPYDTMRLPSGYAGQTPFVIKTVDDTTLKGKDSFVQVNPRTAKSLGLAEGKHARLETPRGEARVRVHLFEGIGPDMVAIPRGLGHTAHSGYVAHKGVNVNELIGSVEDPASGLDAAWGIRAKLTKA